MSHVCEVANIWSPEEGRFGCRQCFPDGIAFKRCSKCEAWLPAEIGFYRRHPNGGPEPRCKQCSNKARNDRYRRDRDGRAETIAILARMRSPEAL